MTRKIGALIVASLAAVVITSLTLHVANAQNRNRIVQKLTAPGVGEPVGISNFKVSGRAIEFDKELLEGSDWVGRITFDVANTSGKGITYFEIDGLVAAPDLPGGIIVVPLARFGSNTGIGGIAATALLRAGDVAHCMAATRYDQLPQSLRSKLADCYRLSLVVNSVMFSDDSRWFRGTLLRRDPTNSNRWIRPSSQSSSSQRYMDRAMHVSHSPNRLVSGNWSGPVQGGCGALDMTEYIPCSGYGCYFESTWITPYSNPDYRHAPVYIVCSDPMGFGNCELTQLWDVVLCGFYP